VCGIAGKLSARADVEEELIRQMCATLRHRGPDSSGSYCDAEAGLGIQRLAIIDVETGDQPIQSEDGSVVVVHNGEIYNYRELREDLVSRGHRFSTASDTEVIVHLYEELGDDCVTKLRGMFAFALWDRRRRRALLARDRLGKKPLFYAERDERLWFGSETKAIVRDPGIPRDVDYGAIDQYLHYQYVPAPHSAFRALRKLPPAHVLTWEGGRSQISRYWRASYRPKLALPREELCERIRAELVDATRLRLRSDVPLGALLSGGVDSSAVVAAISRSGASGLKTFSIGFREKSHDESAYARQVASIYGTDHHELVVEPSLEGLLPRLAWHYGEPFADHSAIPSFALAEITRSEVSVALNGDGGDECFGGYDRYSLADAARMADTLPRAVWKAGARHLAYLGAPAATSARSSQVRRALELLGQAPWQRYANYVAYFRAEQRSALYTPEARAALDEDAALAVVRDPWTSSDAEDDVERLLDVDLQTYLPGDLLVKMDIATMAHSLEVRSPLLDHRIVELAARIPRKEKLRGRQRKRIFRDAMRPWLPDEILDRPKRGFAVPLIEWFRGPLRDVPGEILLDPATLARGIFEKRAVATLIDDHANARANNARRLWALIQLELWFRTFIDRTEPGPITYEPGASSV
jgi:asparagine synthase (glutamine-hydrolysing)